MKEFIGTLSGEARRAGPIGVQGWIEHQADYREVFGGFCDRASTCPEPMGLSRDAWGEFTADAVDAGRVRPGAVYRLDSRDRHTGETLESIRVIVASVARAGRFGDATCEFHRIPWSRPYP